MSEPQKENLTFEVARDELERIVRQLEDGNVTLQESLDLWQRGEELAAHCDRLLGHAESRIEAAKAEMDEPT
jgi:exodeoxyribonuclease VII small subunit